MEALTLASRHFQRSLNSRGWPRGSSPAVKYYCLGSRGLSYTPIRRLPNPADDPDFLSIVDHPPKLVRTGRRHGPGLIILALIPITAFGLGSWQIYRLGQKTEKIAKLEDRLVRDPLPLPPYIDPTAIKDFDYRRVFATGHFRHDRELLIGPRLYDGTNGYLVITPLERDGEGTMVLVNRGWIPKTLRNQKDRPEGLPTGLVTVEGLLREPWQKNMFTPDNRPDIGEYYFPDVKQMAEITRSQPVWIEQTMQPTFLEILHRESKGIPIGRPAELHLINNHVQYIFTWYVPTGFSVPSTGQLLFPYPLNNIPRYALSLATSVMLWMVVRKPPSDLSRRIRQNREW